MLRDARAEELDEISTLLSVSYAQYMPENPSPAWVDYERDIGDVRKRLAVSTLIVAEVDGGVAGAVTFYPDGALGDDPWPARWSALRLLAVHPDARGRGLGRALTEECIRRARALGSVTIGLHTTTLMNVARAMYEGMGFTRVPEHDFLPDPDVLVMAYKRDL